MSNISMSDAELLKFAIENGMLDAALVQEKIEMQKREELLKKHPYTIWEDKNGTWYTYLPDTEKGRVLKKRKSRTDVEDLVIKFWKEQSDNPTIKEVFDEWNDRKLSIGKISDATHLRNEQIFNRHYKDFGKMKIKNVDTSEWEDFLEEQITLFNLTAKAFSNLKSITKGFLKRAKKRGYISFGVEETFLEMDFSEKDFKSVHKEDCQEVFMEDELPVMLDYLVNNQDIHNIGILLMFVTGMRVGELVSLKYSDFCDNGTVIHINRTETRYVDDNGKYVCGIKENPKTQAGIRDAIIPKDYSWIYMELRKLNPFGEYAFEINGNRMTAQSIRMRMKRICKKLGIVHKSPHKARKTYGSILLDNHIDNNMIIGQMGHTDILCTEKHYHRNRKSMSRKVDVINNIPEFIAK